MRAIGQQRYWHLAHPLSRIWPPSRPFSVSPTPFAPKSRLSIFLPLCRLSEPSQHCRSVSPAWSARESPSDHVARFVWRARSGRRAYRLDELPHHFILLPSRRHRLLLLQTEWRNEARETARDATRGRYSRT